MNIPFVDSAIGIPCKALSNIISIFAYIGKKLKTNSFLKNRKFEVIHCHSPNMIRPVISSAKRFRLISSMMVNEQFMTCAASNKHINNGKTCEHCTIFKTFFCNRIGASFYKRKVLAVYFYYRMLRYRWAARSYDLVFCVSNDVKDRLASINLINTQVVFNIIDPVLHKGPTEKISIPIIKQIKEKYRNLVLFVAGDLSDSAKGSHLVFQAAKSLEDFAFLCVGKRPKAHSFQLPNVFFTGRLKPEEMADYYRGSDAVVIPSVCPDALPRVGLEALAYSKPIVGLRYGGIPDIVVDGVNGLLFSKPDALELAEKLKALFACPQKLRPMGENSLRRAKDIFSPEKAVDKIISSYNRIRKI